MQCSPIGNRRTLPRESSLCHIVFRMPLGQIVGMGFVASAVYYRIAIIGGTGVYRNIGGEIISITLRQHPHRERITMSVIAFGG